MRKKSYLTLWLIAFIFLALPPSFRIAGFGWADLLFAVFLMLAPVGAAFEARIVEREACEGQGGVDLESVKW